MLIYIHTYIYIHTHRHLPCQKQEEKGRRIYASMNKTKRGRTGKNGGGTCMRVGACGSVSMRVYVEKEKEEEKEGERRERKCIQIEHR